MIRWFARNNLAANLLWVAVMLAGAWSAWQRVPLEVQPAQEFHQVDVNVTYRGASPEDLEKAVIIPMESALEGLSGVKNIESRAGNGNGKLSVFTQDGVDPKEMMDEIQTRISRINSFPAETEPPRYSIPDSSQWFDVIKIAVTGKMDETDLLAAARKVRDDVTGMKGISQATIQGTTPHEISIEADPMRLRDYGLRFSDLTTAIQRSSVDVPAGQIQADGGSLMIRSKGQAYVRADFENILVSNHAGASVRLGEVAKIKDGFEENRKILRFNGEPCLIVEVQRLQKENALEIAELVRNYVATGDERFPQGISVHVWDDSSVELRGRLSTLADNLVQGSLLVLLLLGVFLRPKIAFWVVMGIPFSFAGAFILMPFFGITANVMSLFAFIFVAGVVDDAIVTAETIYMKLRDGVEPLDAAADGAREVAVPVTFGVIITVVAFLPLMFFSNGYLGTLMKQIPPIVAGVLFFSLLETKLCMPSHLKSLQVHRKNPNAFARFQHKMSAGLEWFVEHAYQPTLRATTRHRYVTLAFFLALALGCFGLFSSGRLGFINMPSIDRNTINATIKMPGDTPLEETDQRVVQVAAAVDQLRKEFVDPGTGKSWIGDMVMASGGSAAGGGPDSRTGNVTVSVTDPGERTIPGPKNSVIAHRWTQIVGKLPGVESFWISGDTGNSQREDGVKLESMSIQVLGPASAEKDQVVRDIEELVESYPGIADASSDVTGNKDELIIKIRPEGEALGLTQRELANQVRAAFFGDQAQKVQRDRDSIRVMVRLPQADRQTLATLDQLRIRTPSGGEAPFRAVASAAFSRARSDIKRIDGAQIVSVKAQPVDETVNVVDISRNLAPRLDAMLSTHAGLFWRYTGYVADHEETKNRIFYGGIGLFVIFYALLAIPFRSLYQPLFVMLGVPFGIIGALIGHIVMDITPSYLSVFGMLALTGVVVNDSLVIVEFINQKVRAGEPVFEAVIESGCRRFRPILLTSLTTFVGLVPMLFDRSLQAQFLIPMATSLAFGIIFAAAITLYLIPAAYVAAEELMLQLKKLWAWYRRPFLKTPAGALLESE